MKIFLIIIAALFLLNFSCAEESSSGLTSEKILFYVAHENYAWGHQFTGWFIDNEGNVWDLKTSIKWWDKEMNIDGFQGEFWIGKDSLYREYSSKANGIIYKISMDQLEKGLELESKIKTISYSEPQNVMVDAGGTVYGYLKYDPSRKAFRQIPLALEGDWEYHVQDEKAYELKEWLSEIATEMEEN